MAVSLRYRGGSGQARGTGASPSSPTRSGDWPSARRPRAAEIGVIVESVQGETSATVMAMEKGARQMQQGRPCWRPSTDAAGKVRLTTQQQRSATPHVVETVAS